MTYTDDNAVLPAKNILMGIALICAVLFFLNVWRRTWLLPSVGLALLVLSAILLGLIWPGIVQQFQVNPTEADKEAPYIEANIEATRAAYDLEDVEVEPFTSEASAALGELADLVGADLVGAAGRPAAGRRTFEQHQQVRGYYSVAPTCSTSTATRSTGTDRALVLGVRELDQDGIDETDQNWSNLHTVYTHGNGVIAAYGNQRDAENERTESTEIQWAEGQQAGQDALSQLGPGRLRGPRLLRRAEPRLLHRRQGRRRTRPTSSSTWGRRTGEEPRAQTTTYDGDGGVAGRQPLPASCCTP